MTAQPKRQSQPVAPVLAVCAAFAAQPSVYPPEARRPDVAPTCGSVAGMPSAKEGRLRANFGRGRSRKRRAGEKAPRLHRQPPSDRPVPADPRPLPWLVLLRLRGHRDHGKLQKNTPLMRLLGLLMRQSYYISCACRFRGRRIPYNLHLRFGCFPHRNAKCPAPFPCQLMSLTRGARVPLLGKLSAFSTPAPSS